MFVYWWFEQDIRVVKIGHGKDPVTRMRDYCQNWRLTADEHSLVMRQVPQPENMEAHLHRVILEAGHTKLRIGNTGPGVANEVFKMGKKSQAEITRLLNEAVDAQIMCEMPSRAMLLGPYSCESSATARGGFGASRIEDVQALQEVMRAERARRLVASYNPDVRAHVVIGKRA